MSRLRLTRRSQEVVLQAMPLVSAHLGQSGFACLPSARTGGYGRIEYFAARGQFYTVINLSNLELNKD
jgi:hypothetical protein